LADLLPRRESEGEAVSGRDRRADANERTEDAFIIILPSSELASTNEGEEGGEEVFERLSVLLDSPIPFRRWSEMG